MAEGDIYIDCTNNEIATEQIYRKLVVEDAAGNPCLKICGEVSTTSGQIQKTPTPIYTNADFSIPAGATEVSILNNGTSNITINGVVTPPGIRRRFGDRNPTDSALNIVTSGNNVSADYMA